MSTKSGEEAIRAVVEEAAWDYPSTWELTLEYLKEKNLEADFEEFLRKKALEEQEVTL